MMDISNYHILVVAIISHYNMTVTLGCGDTATENVTYFSSGNAIAASARDNDCIATICKISGVAVCQIRLEFIEFALSGPSTDATVVGRAVSGVPNDGPANRQVTNFGRCDTDTFRVVNDGTADGTPVICGQNSGQHSWCCKTLRSFV